MKINAIKARFYVEQMTRNICFNLHEKKQLRKALKVWMYNRVIMAQTKGIHTKATSLRKCWLQLRMLTFL